MSNPKRTVFANIVSTVMTSALVIVTVWVIYYMQKKELMFFMSDSPSHNEAPDLPELLAPALTAELNTVAQHQAAMNQPDQYQTDDYFKKFAFRDKLEEKKRLEELERKRIAEEKRKAAEAEKKRLADIAAKKKAEEEAKQKAIAAEKKRLEEIALKKKQAEEQKKKEEAERQKQLADQKAAEEKAAKVAAEKKRLADEKAKADKAAADKAAAEKKRLADEKAKADKAAAEKAAAEKKRIADEKAKADKAAADKAAAERKAKADAAAAAENDRIATAYLMSGGFLGAIQSALYSHWRVPTGSSGLTATIVFYVDAQGNITKIDDRKSKYSGNTAFDDSVKAAILRTGKIRMPDNQHAINKLVKEGIEVTFDPKEFF